MLFDEALAARSGIVVFARADSRRLPGKVLRPLLGRPMLGWTISRLRRSRLASTLVVATSNRPCDDAIERLGWGMAVPVVRGSCENVLGRAVTAAQTHALDVVVRISGDSPFVDPEIVDEMLAHQAETGADVVTNVYPERRLMPGLSVEVITKRCLAWADEEAVSTGDREHVTRLIYRRAKTGGCLFRIEPAGPEFPAPIKLAVDTEQDFLRAEVVAEAIEGSLEHASWRDVVELFLERAAGDPLWTDIPPVKGATRQS